jgi:peptide/nickel transport system substrate-binding protein
MNTAGCSFRQGQVMDLRVLNGVGPRIARHTITDVWMSPFPSYEDMELKN